MQMDETTQQNAALVEEAAAASQAIVEQAQALNGMIARYNVGGEGAGNQPRKRRRPAPNAVRRRAPGPPRLRRPRVFPKPTAPHRRARLWAMTAEWKEF